MKRILITGANSYIGTSFEEHMKQFKDYSIDTLDMIDSSWKEHDFSRYDVVFHVAGIAHSDITKATEETKRLYYAINTDLTIEVASVARNSGVKQFVFMSSMIVYGDRSNFKQYEEINSSTCPSPSNFYGDSKLKAEEGLCSLQNTEFTVTILRPPMIYGKGCKGNFISLEKLSKYMFVCPKIDNLRSVLYIDNLSKYVKKICDTEQAGIFLPQDNRQISTTDMICDIRNYLYHKTTVKSKLLGYVVIFCSKLPIKMGKLAKKAFSESYYSIEEHYDYFTDFSDNLRENYEDYNC